LLGLVGTAISTYVAVKAWLKNVKTKSSQEIWGMLMEMADAAMTEAEKTLASGADKKAMAMNTIKASAEAAGIDMSLFIGQLDTYIDQTIAFVNKMQK
jgi:hypothetical protein